MFFGLELPPQHISDHMNNVGLNEICKTFGARAILKDYRIDLLGDRMSYKPEGYNETHRKLLWAHSMLLNWVDNEGLPFLRQEYSHNRYKIDGSIETSTYKIDGKFAITANATSGYLYIGAYQFQNPKYRYELITLPDETYMWTGKQIPKIGDHVTINFNNLGSGTVLDYFVENTRLGVRVLLNNKPEWKKEPWAMIFGNELA